MSGRSAGGPASSADRNVVGDAFPMALASPHYARRPTWDVIVVGARCAGSPTAMLLARAGFRVLLIDRAHFPSDSMRCHFIQRTGIEYLSRWGLLPRAAASGC